MGYLDNLGIIGGADGPTAIFFVGVLNTQALVISIVVGILLCVFGLKIMRVLSAMAGLTVGAGIGACIVLAAKLEGPPSAFTILGCAVVVAIVAAIFKKIGAFISVFVYGTGALMTFVPLDSLIFVLIAFVAALILAVLAAIYEEPMVIIVSALAGGVMAGLPIASLIGMDSKVWVGYVISSVIALIGMFLQFWMQSRKIGKKERIHAQKVREEDSMELEVEKARMILDEEDIE